MSSTNGRPRSNSLCSQCLPAMAARFRLQSVCIQVRPELEHPSHAGLERPDAEEKNTSAEPPGKWDSHAEQLAAYRQVELIAPMEGVHQKLVNGK
jgi:hypothetical protein